MAAAACKGFPRTVLRAEWHRAAMLSVKRAGQQLLGELTLSFFDSFSSNFEQSLVFDGGWTP